VQHTTWLSLVRNIITTMNSDSLLCGSFELYHSYVAGIDVVEEIHFMFSVMTLLYALNMPNNHYPIYSVLFLVFYEIKII
jgi:hypothetical protein